MAIAARWVVTIGRPGKAGSCQGRRGPRSSYRGPNFTNKTTRLKKTIINGKISPQKQKFNKSGFKIYIKGDKAYKNGVVFGRP
jgi:hypothetical protein